MDAWLVVQPNEPEYFEQYKLFTNSEAAYTFAKSVGWRDDLGMGRAVCLADDVKKASDGN